MEYTEWTEYITRIVDGVLVNDDGEVCMKAEFVSKLVRCEMCAFHTGSNACTKKCIKTDPDDFCKHAVKCDGNCETCSHHDYVYPNNFDDGYLTCDLMAKG